MSNAIKLTGIEWDADNINDIKDLPNEITIREMDLPDYIWEDLEEAISDYLAEKYGFCNRGYAWKFIRVKDSFEGGKEND